MTVRRKESEMVVAVKKQRNNKKQDKNKTIFRHVYLNIKTPRPNGLKKKNSFNYLFDKYYDSLYRDQLGIILLPKK